MERIIVSKVEDVHQDMLYVSEGELLEVGVGYGYLGPQGSQVTILVCKCKRTRCLAATQVLEHGHACQCSGLLYWLVARIGMDIIIVEVPQSTGVVLQLRFWKVLN